MLSAFALDPRTAASAAAAVASAAAIVILRSLARVGENSGARVVPEARENGARQAFPRRGEGEKSDAPPDFMFSSLVFYILFTSIMPYISYRDQVRYAFLFFITSRFHYVYTRL